MRFLLDSGLSLILTTGEYERTVVNMSVVSHPLSLSSLTVDGATRDSNASSPRFLSYRDESTGRWARLCIDRDDDISGLYFTGEELHVLRSYKQRGRRRRLGRADPRAGALQRFTDLPRTPEWHSLARVLRAQRGGDGAVPSNSSASRRQRRLACPQCPAGPPYGRLPGCPTSGVLRVLQLGVQIDHGFTQAAGGTDAAHERLGAALHLINGLFEDQLGAVLNTPRSHT